MPAFVPGVDLARGFYRDVVRPVVEEAFGDLPHSAALIGDGSEVLGYDTERSTDHSWGPRLQLFVAGSSPRGSEVVGVLRDQIPATYEGWATRFAPKDHEPVALRVDVHDLPSWFDGHLGFDPGAGVLLFDWLATPTQLLLTATAGEVFHDGLGQLHARRRAVAWYPHDVWLYVVAAQWRRVAQEEPFVGRAGEVGDDLGSRVVAARVAREIMRLCFLLERRYPPYSKWLGRAFETLACAPEVGHHLARALSATTWQRREAELGVAAERAGEMHNALGITEPIDASLRPFHDRPFLVLDSGRFADAAWRAITDPEVTALPRDIGAVDQWIDSTDVLSVPARARAAARSVLG